MKDKDYFPVIVVANKCDLEYERQVGGHGAFSPLSPATSQSQRLIQRLQRGVTSQSTLAAASSRHPRSSA